MSDKNVCYKYYIHMYISGIGNWKNLKSGCMTEDEKNVHVSVQTLCFMECLRSCVQWSIHNFSTSTYPLPYKYEYWLWSLKKKKTKNWTFLFLNIVKILLLQGQLCSILFKVWNSSMRKTGKGWDCQILPERKSAIIEVWHGIAYLTSPCRQCRAKRNP